MFNTPMTKWGAPALLLALLLLAGCDVFSKEITAYKASCATYDATERKFVRCYTLRTTNYRVVPERGEVVYWADEQIELNKLVNCAIRDSKNWTCTYHDGSGPVVARDGLLPAYLTGARPTISLRRYQWWYLRLAILFTDKLPNLGALYVPDQFTCEVLRPNVNFCKELHFDGN